MHQKNKNGVGDCERPNRFWWHFTLIAVGVTVVSLLVTKVLLDQKILRPPYPAFGKQVAWLLGEQESAYNFDEVVPGLVYRSSNPDLAFLEYLKAQYGVGTVVSLAGPQDWFEDAEKMGMKVHRYGWGTSKLPGIDELGEVEKLMEQAEKGDAVLVHCSAGADRTGYAVALYRVKAEGWKLDDAVEEMRGYWHFPETKEMLHLQMKVYLESPIETAQAKPPAWDNAAYE
ncbi:Dual specificity phosphatase, catalytic domain [Poriferisphaera corsica]|uniref:Dual specificity phosphatase, catalytic domain n=1 Tax=Poriferisphaera corsica TaxID=2528020 RepID=A0A517YRF3_9BACT|nr:dual specificity protein phosphatase family protein [Poriferisphaera corsica]QDU32808.1 Dual specificity phosphatase, catalytic domain [Poriferisphaera corsica]